MYEYKCKVLRVVDGDTFIGQVDLGFNMTTQQRFRVDGIDTPETYRPKTESERAHGKEATARAIELLDSKTISIRTNKTGKYNRWIATVILNDGSDYSTVMINEGFEKRDNYV